MAVVCQVATFWRAWCLAFVAFWLDLGVACYPSWPCLCSHSGGEELASRTQRTHGVGVTDGVGVIVGVSVGVGVGVLVDVAVGVEVGVGESVAVAVGVDVGGGGR